MDKSAKFAQLFLRLALGFSFLSAVADRFGMWGAQGEPSVAWGNWSSFLDYTYLLVPYMSRALSDIAGTVATVAEVLFGILLIIGFKTRLAALGSALLLVVFALSMFVFLGAKAPFDYSVFTAAAGAFLLAAVAKYEWSVDQSIGK
ncbi:DoxX family membrane protein [Limibacter armeniacum]|uniref:DoxX family membrane protein n=1 Tax=Limibacter armeniacum TaxID=466084 RepID=UPI002FE65177